jgi:hypothetical protein
VWLWLWPALFVPKLNAFMLSDLPFTGERGETRPTEGDE